MRESIGRPDDERVKGVPGVEGHVVGPLGVFRTRGNSAVTRCLTHLERLERSEPWVLPIGLASRRELLGRRLIDLDVETELDLLTRAVQQGFVDQAVEAALQAVSNH